MHIGIFTSGGDCAGLNSIIYAATKAAQKSKIKITGLINGFYKFIIPPFSSIDLSAISGSQLHDLYFKGGTILGGVTKGDPYSFPMPDGTKQNVIHTLQTNLKNVGIDGLIVVGGDGSFRITSRVSHDLGISFVGIPKTIDNDVWGTDYAVGFMTAVHNSADAIRKIHTTAASHNRIFVVELMGRDAGFLTLYAGLAGGAHAILVPEFQYDPKALLQALQAAYDKYGYAILAVTESVKNKEGQKSLSTDHSGYKRYSGIAHYFCEWIQSQLHIDTRAMVLGHLQRGGEPIDFDRLLALQFGTKAVHCLQQGKTDIVLGYTHGRITEIPINEIVTQEKHLTSSNEMVGTALNMGIYLGEEIA